MIKVNLLKTKVETGAHTVVDGETQDYTGFENFEDGPVVDQSDAIAKMLLMLLSVAILIGYEWYGIGEKEKQLKIVSAQVAQKQNELNSLGGQNIESTQLKTEIEEIKAKLDILDSLSKKRLKELKALDYLQSVIPDGVWMSNIQYNGRTSLLEGYSVTETDLDNFIRSLEKSTYFLNVERLSSITQTSSKVSATGYKKFKISTEIGEEN
ncbi:MAG: PilN domain-containing protein [Bdellovibrionales bacterium]|nr:PilN domain-containing protein [Bdellovibrionales bacterium]